MNSVWYRLPEDDKPLDVGQTPRGGKVRGRGRGRGRGNTRHAQEPRDARHDAATPFHMNAMGQQYPMHAAYAPHQYYYNPTGMEEMSPHWQYVHSHGLYPTDRQPNPVMMGYQRFPANHAPHAGHQFGNYETAGRREPPSQPAREIQNNSTGFHHTYSYPAYARYTNQIPTPHSGHQQLADNRSGQKGRKHQPGLSPSVGNETSQRSMTVQRVNLPVNSQTLQLQTAANLRTTSHCHQTLQRTPSNLKSIDLTATPTTEPQAHKTLAETVAFLNDPQLVFQNTKVLSPSVPADPTRKNCATLSQSLAISKTDKRAAISLLPSQAHQTQEERSLIHRGNYASRPVPMLRSHENVQDMICNYSSHATPDKQIISTQIPDFRKYSELSVTLAVDPPPAHQATAAETNRILKHPDLYTPPLAHQAPASQMSALPQSATTSTSPPPAHQASTTHMIHRLHPYHHNESQIVRRQATAKLGSACAVDKLVAVTNSDAADNARPKRQRNKSKSKTSAKMEGVLGATHAIYQPNQMLGEAQIMYQPSTETFASEQVLYQPQIDMYTKEQIVYQPRKKILAKTQVVYQPRTEFIATAEAVYQSDMVAARQTVIQSQAGTMKTAEAVYDTQNNTMAMAESIRNSQANMVRTAEALYRHEAEILAARQTSYQPRNESRKTTKPAKTYIHRPREDIPAERQTILQTAAVAQARSHYACAREGSAQTELYKAAPILRNILCNEPEGEQEKSQQSEMAALQKFLLENYNQVVNNPSNSVTPNQTLRQTRKRKMAQPQPHATASPPQQPVSEQRHELVPSRTAASSTAPGAAPNIEPIIALNWTLQSLAASWQVQSHLLNLLENVVNNNANARNLAEYNDN